MRVNVKTLEVLSVADLRRGMCLFYIFAVPPDLCCFFCCCYIPGIYDGSSSDTDEENAPGTPDSDHRKPRSAARLKLPKNAKEKKAEKEKEEALAAAKALQEELSNIEARSLH